MTRSQAIGCGAFVACFLAGMLAMWLIEHVGLVLR